MDRGKSTDDQGALNVNLYLLEFLDDHNHNPIPPTPVLRGAIWGPVLLPHVTLGCSNKASASSIGTYFPVWGAFRHVSLGMAPHGFCLRVYAVSELEMFGWGIAVSGWELQSADPQRLQTKTNFLIISLGLGFWGGYLSSIPFSLPNITNITFSQEMSAFRIVVFNIVVLVILLRKGRAIFSFLTRKDELSYFLATFCCLQEQGKHSRTDDGDKGQDSRL
ncbi:hypothetical protein SODALDRAFT_362219 [Sodiomyces alkalinus F11]|uniref:Uncharacterized protein n=1 Tax=Sodiomyces alkalinus (strain CBS 110278 / VKM F-3762 / F11) TaxID=1314773 RepID=A0A3N2PPI2_SODAK|nr:hypothetical protein SODALDRAFT_362219 [Sodiomyces alkalinus F11]ROT36415.1 hypothetical protein SODALDRAFT_362219 [Sodiomyces alkalinus F11]